jgi:hypothetical protein
MRTLITLGSAVVFVTSVVVTAATFIGAATLLGVLGDGLIYKTSPKEKKDEDDKNNR